MPIYEYACDSCHSRIEIQQKLSDPPLTICNKCGGPVKKLISPPAIMFKGSGWYVTDYSDKLKPPTSTEGGESKPKADDKSGTTETKPSTAGTGNGAASTASTPSSSAGTSSSGTTPSSTPASSSSS